MFFNGVWALTSGGFRIVSDTLVIIIKGYWLPTSVRPIRPMLLTQCDHRNLLITLIICSVDQYLLYSMM